MPIPTDPVLAQQWHLHNTTPGLLDLNVFGVWDPAGGGRSYTGAGTTTAVIDDGFDYNHSDFTNYDQTQDFDFGTLVDDAFGNPTDSHGHAVAGIIGAAANGTGAVGIAFDTTIIGYRLYLFISDFMLQNVRDAIHRAAVTAEADVVNMSIGITNLAGSEFGTGFDPLRFAEIRDSIGTAVDDGRGELGMTLVRSAGNRRSTNYEVNANALVNDTRQVVVAAVNQDGFVSSYSSYGAAILVSGFGTPGEVVTTDRVGADGYNATDFTSGFNGTSSATPMVTGVVALMYEAAPGLGWRDVQSILAASARHVGSEVGAGIAGAERYEWNFNTATNWNGGGMHFSNDYGYGLVDALAAVRMAETWLLGGQEAQVTANQFAETMDVLDVPTIIPDDNETGLTFSGAAGSDVLVERVTVQMTFSTTFLWDMEIYLISPDGTVSQLIDNAGNDLAFDGTWTFETQAFRGQKAAGTWSVRVADVGPDDVLTVLDIAITIFGQSTINDRYVFTDEFSDYANGAFGHLTNIVDTNGGIDTINLAAITGNTEIDLNGNLSFVDGVEVTFSGIENVIGGDGSDEVTGNAARNLIHGMRGEDYLLGEGGSDTIHGGAGFDEISGGTSADLLYGDEGGDIIFGGSSNDTLYGGTGNDSLRGGTQDDLMHGDADNDLLYGEGGSDTLYGGEGGDTLFGGSANDTLFGGTGADALYGEENDDFLSGEAASDTLYGGDGNDTLDGGTSSDTLRGGAGADLLYGGSSADDMRGGTDNDALYGGTQNDLLLGEAGNDSLHGDDGDDNLAGDAGDDRLYGGIGADTVDGGSGADSVYGQAGADSLLGGSGADLIYGGSENDTIRGGTSHDTIYGGAHDDSLFGDDGLDSLFGGDGNDTLDGGTASDTLEGDGGADLLFGGASSDLLLGGTGNDTLYGGALDDFAAGGDGDDSLFGDDGNDLLYGDAGTDRLYGGLGADTVEGGSGADSLYGQEGDDSLLGGSGADLIYGGSENDTLLGGTSNDTLYGGAQDDVLFGEDGLDSLFGGDGNDTLNGGGGSDTLSGGAGADVFVFNSTIGASIDSITGFNVADDTIWLENAVFTGLSAGALLAEAFVANLTGLAGSTAHRLIYRSDTGALIFDADGDGGGAGVQFATLGTGLALTEADFLVI